MMSQKKSICVLGGLGAMGRVVVKCLLREDSKVKVTVADRMKPVTKLSSRVTFRPVDLRDHRALVKVLRGHQVVINSTSHHFNLPVMRAALDAGVHYLDLGGLFHYTRKQLKWNERFAKKGLMAVLGMGCAPGVANLLAKWAGNQLEEVDEAHIKIGGRIWGPEPDEIPYAVGTIREELTWKPPIYDHGRWRFMPARSGMEWHRFPSPVGKQRIFRTVHSEVATLPRYFHGLKGCSFKIGFSDKLIRAVLAPRGKKRVMPASELKSLKPARDCEITLAWVSGKVGGKRRVLQACYIAHSHGGQSAGDWNTAWPPAVVSLMMARGEIRGVGVYAPEDIVPEEVLFTRLKRQGFRFRLLSGG